MKIEKIVKPEQFITSISITIDVEEIPNFLPKTFMKIAEYISKSDAKILSAPFVSYQNLRDDFDLPEGKVDIEVGFPLDKLIEETDEIKSYVLEQYKALSALFIGKYDDMAKVYFEMYDEINKNGNKFKNISYEYYLSDEEVDYDKQETILELVYE